MSSKYPILPPKKIIKIMEQKFGFERISQKGSHVQKHLRTSKYRIRRVF